MLSADEALQRLREGNARFTSNVRSLDSLLSHVQRADHAVRQEPYAVILGCSDSRVPAELIFDAGVGDLFVIRVAGNVVAASQVGSVEFAAEQFGTPLVVVLGHTQCGAIRVTLEQLSRPGDAQSDGLKSIVNRVRPSVETLIAAGLRGDELVRQSVRANIRASANQLRHGSPILERRQEFDGLLVVGAEYSLDTGKVEFFDIPGRQSTASP